MESLRPRQIASYGAGAVLAFHLAYCFPSAAVLMIGYLFCVMQLARAATRRQAYYSGLIVGVLCFGPQLAFFWRIFGPGALALYYVLAFWTALFVVMGRACLLRWGPLFTAALLPFIWTGIEYFRSELYYLRFSWLNIGYAFSGEIPAGIFAFLGMYGIGFAAATLAAALLFLRGRLKPAQFTFSVLLLAIGFGIFALWPGQKLSHPAPAPTAKSVAVAGVQLEFPTDDDVIAALNRLLKSSPETELFVLSEYTFQDVVPPRVKRWCHEHQRYLIVGGKDPAGPLNFYNTAFVVDPTGEIVFRQPKKVPIQFFKDGLAAPEQNVWESPWGRIGLGICYDMSYTRVTDALIRRGAQTLIVPTMDVADWGQAQHELHARVAPVRAAEYGVPIFRVANSGISQLVGADGRVLASAGFPGDREALSGHLVLGKAGSLPVDRWLAPFATGLTVLLMAWLISTRRTQPPSAQSPK